MRLFLIITLIITTISLWYSFKFYNTIPDEGPDYYDLAWEYNMQPEDYRPVNIFKPILSLLSLVTLILLILPIKHTKTIVLITSIAFIVFTLWHWVYFLWYCRSFLKNGITGVPLAHSFVLINSILGIILYKSGKLKTLKDTMEEIDSEDSNEIDLEE